MERVLNTIPETFMPSDADLVSQGMLLDKQTFEQIYNRDQEALRILGYTAQEVADLLGEICERACQENRFEHTAPNGKKYQVEVERFRGKKCPWSCRFDFKKYPSSVNLLVTEVGKTEKIRIAGLLRHLIENHGFFEGGAYRVAPETIVEMFGKEKEGYEGSIERAKTLSL